MTFLQVHGVSSEDFPLVPGTGTFLPWPSSSVMFISPKSDLGRKWYTIVYSIYHLEWKSERSLFSEKKISFSVKLKCLIGSYWSSQVSSKWMNLLMILSWCFSYSFSCQLLFLFLAKRNEDSLSSFCQFFLWVETEYLSMVSLLNSYFPLNIFFLLKGLLGQMY